MTNHARQILISFLIFILAISYVFILGNNLSQAASIAGHIVISEVQTSGVVGGSYDDFVELYNPTATAIDISTWSIQRSSEGGGSLYRKQLTGSIPAYGFYLIVRDHSNTDSALKALADVLASGSSFTLADDNIVYLVSNYEYVNIDDIYNDPDIIDMVGMGAAIYYEGSSQAPNPGIGQSLERKSGSTHEEGQGNGWDTDNNADDFFVSDNPSPQNTGSEPEMPEWLDGGDGENGEGDGEGDADEEEVKSLREMREMREMREEKDRQEMQVQDKTQRQENTIREMRSLGDMKL